MGFRADPYLWNSDYGGVANGQFDISFIPFIAPGFRFHISPLRLGRVPMFFINTGILYMSLSRYLYRVVSNNTHRNGLLDVVSLL